MGTEHGGEEAQSSECRSLPSTTTHGEYRAPFSVGSRISHFRLRVWKTKVPAEHSRTSHQAWQQLIEQTTQSLKNMRNFFSGISALALKGFY